MAPRFDLCSEVMIASLREGAIEGEPRTMLLSGPSADEICAIAIKEEVGIVVSGGMEEEHYQYLQWKKITVLDRVVGRVDDVMHLLLQGALKAGSIVKPAVSI